MKHLFLYQLLYLVLTGFIILGVYRYLSISVDDGVWGCWHGHCFASSAMKLSIAASFRLWNRASIQLMCYFSVSESRFGILASEESMNDLVELKAIISAQFQVHSRDRSKLGCAGTSISAKSRSL